MHPILAQRRRLGAYLASWVLLGGLLSTLLAAATTFNWFESIVFALPLAIVYAFVGLGSFWVCRAAPLELKKLLRALGTQLAAAFISAALWLVVGRGYAHALDRYGPFPGLAVKQTEAAALLLGLGVVLYLLSASLHYLLVAFETSQEAERRALELEIASREAELRTLRAQIHPHFLFNSLNSINALIAARPEEARRLCVRLADFLRRSLTLGSRETVLLSEELDLAETLLAIEKTRFGERLTVDVQAGDGCTGCKVPPLVLQPLVENAVTHGIATMLDGGTVRVHAERRRDQLRLVVENPRDPESPDPKGAGIGLKNVSRRVDAHYGSNGEMRVTAEADSFRVELRLPCSE